MSGIVKRVLACAALATASMLCLLGAGIQTAHAAPITEFSNGVGMSPGSLTVGPDGNLWFVDQDTSGKGTIGRITPAGQITEFTQANGQLTGSSPSDIAPGPEGDLWFSDMGTTQAIGRITPAGQITETAAGTGTLPATAHPGEMIEGPNGTVFYLDNGSPRQIGEISAQGAISEVPAGIGAADLNDLTAGPDGNIYFTFSGGPSGVGKLDVLTGFVSLTLTGPGTMPVEITAGPDGNLWEGDEMADTVSRLSIASETLTPFGTMNGLQANGDPDGGITAGPDGNVWFSDQYSGNYSVARITPLGTISEFPISETPWDITTGIDGNLWLPLNDKVIRVTPSGIVTDITAGLTSGSQFTDGTNIITGPDGNLWAIANDGAPKGIVRVDVQLPPAATTGAASTVTTSSAAIAGTANPRGNAASVVVDYGTTTTLGTKVAAATLPISDQASNIAATLPGLAPGTTYDYRVEATNAYGTGAGVIQTFTTAPSPATVTTKKTQTLVAHVGDQKITVVTTAPNACVAHSSALSVSLDSTAVKGSHAATLHFRGAAFFLDRGVKHTKRIHTRVHGKLKTAKKVTFTANATVHHVPVTTSLRLDKLTGKTHTLKVVVVYTKAVKRHGHKQTVTVTKTVRSKFAIC